MIQATLNNLLTFYLSLFKVSSEAAAHIEKLYRNFLWNGHMKKKKVFIL